VKYLHADDFKRISFLARLARRLPVSSQAGRHVRPGQSIEENDMISNKPETRSIATPYSQRAQNAQHDAATPTPPQRRAVNEDDFQVEFSEAPVEIDPRVEDEYWSKHYRDSRRVDADTPYEHVRAAYRFGWESRRRLPAVSWSVALPRLRSEWNADPANFMMSWNEAEPAVQDAWMHAGKQRTH
jgi:hypothetical protein